MFDQAHPTGAGGDRDNTWRPPNTVLELGGADKVERPPRGASRRDATSAPIGATAKPFVTTDLTTFGTGEPCVVRGAGRERGVQRCRPWPRLQRPDPSLPGQHVQACDIIKGHVVKIPAGHRSDTATELGLTDLGDQTINIRSALRIDLDQHHALHPQDYGRRIADRGLPRSLRGQEQSAAGRQVASIVRPRPC